MEPLAFSDLPEQELRPMDSALIGGTPALRRNGDHALAEICFPA
jgi:hypothetical protein